MLISHSLLSLRGPAPLHHTLLQKRKKTGVTIQTLHAQHFDQGDIVCQTPWPGFEHRCESVPELLALTANEGANMLLTCIRNGDFVGGTHVKMSRSENPIETKIVSAPKITAHDRHLDWKTWKADDIIWRQKIIGPLWNTLKLQATGGTKEKRVIWPGDFVEADDASLLGQSIAIGEPFMNGLGTANQALYVRTCDEKILRTSEITVEGHTPKKPIVACRQAGILSEDVGKFLKSPNERSRPRKLMLGSLY